MAARVVGGGVVQRRPSLHELRDLAAELVRRGISVVPCEPRSTRPLVPIREYQQRLPTPDELTEWFAQYPTANLAVVAGRISDIVVIDVAPGELERIVQHEFPIPNTLAVRTGRGGYHYYCRYPREVRRLPSQTRLLGERGPRVDLYADGGWVVIPPSVHPNGKQYEYLDPDWTLLTDRPLPPLPAWVWAAIAGRVVWAE